MILVSQKGIRKDETFALCCTGVQVKLATITGEIKYHALSDMIGLSWPFENGLRTNPLKATIRSTT